ncbi:hypothetical protein ABGF48_07625 [Helcococcus bovis]|uniref:hypothetical protein n=1 Tax=Helcococcus bovis TaxID=3153252 RepID=UPI0038B7354D
MKIKKDIQNKLKIIFVFLLIIVIILFINDRNKKTKLKISDDEAKNKIMQIFNDNHIEKVENQALILTKNDNYMIMVVGDQYILTDFSQYPPKVHHFKSNKPDIYVKIIEIQKDGYLIEHDDHTHFVYTKVDPNKKVGDYIYIKDPHTYLQDYFEKHKH